MWGWKIYPRRVSKFCHKCCKQYKIKHLDNEITQKNLTFFILSFKFAYFKSTLVDLYIQNCNKSLHSSLFELSSLVPQLVDCSSGKSKGPGFEPKLPPIFHKNIGVSNLRKTQIIKITTSNFRKYCKLKKSDSSGC